MDTHDTSPRRTLDRPCDAIARAAPEAAPQIAELAFDGPARQSDRSQHRRFTTLFEDLMN